MKSEPIEGGGFRLIPETEEERQRLSSISDKLRCFKKENISLREMIERLKSNNYSQPLENIKVIFQETGQEYTMKEFDQLLNN